MSTKQMGESKFKSSRLPQTNESAGEGGLWELCLFAIFFVLVFSAIARADVKAPSAPSAKMATSVKAEKPAITFGGSATIETISTLNPNEPTSYTGWYSLSIGAKHEKSQLRASALLGYTQEYTYAPEEDGTSGAWDNPIFGLSRTFKSGEDFESKWIDGIRLGVSGSLPANRDSAKATFLGSTGVSVEVNKSFGRVGLSQSLGYTRSYFEYDITDAGKVNSPDSYKSHTAIEVSVTDRIDLSAGMQYVHAVSFQGVGKGTQLFTLGAGLKVTEQVGLALGLVTRRGTLDTDGQSNRILLFDQDASVAFLDLTIQM